MTEMLSIEEKAKTIEDVFTLTSPYDSGAECITLSQALQSKWISFDTWMMWNEDPQLEPIFIKESKKLVYYRKFTSWQVLDETVCWWNDVPTTVKVWLAKDIIQGFEKVEAEKGKLWEDEWRIILDQAEIYKKIEDMQRSIQQRSK